MAVFKVSAENLTPVWPLTEPLLRAAIEREKTHDPADVLAALHSGNAQLWIDWRNGVVAAVVTEFVRFPKATHLRVWLAGAVLKPDWAEFEREISEWGRAHRCAALVIEGRKGWLRVFPGLRETGRIMHKHL